MDGSAATISGVATSGSTVELTLSSAVQNGQTVTVAYTDLTANNDSNAIQDSDGNDAATLPTTQVSNNVSSGEIISNKLYATQDASIKKDDDSYTWDGSSNIVKGSSNNPTVALVEFDISSLNRDNSVTSAVFKPYVRDLKDEKSSTFSIYSTSDQTWNESEVKWSTRPTRGDLLDTITISESGSFVDFDVTKAIQSAISEGKTRLTLWIEDQEQEGELIKFDSVNAGSAYPNKPELHIVSAVGPDKTAPKFIAAATSTDGNKIILSYNEELSAATASSDRFSLTVNGNATTIEAVSTSGSDVGLSLGSAITYGETVTVAYTDPTSDNDSNAIQDSNGNDAASLIRTPVTNNSTVDSTAPSFTSAATSTDGTKVILTYNEALSSATADTSAFSVTTDGNANSVTAVAVSGSTVELSLTNTTTNQQTVTVAYTDPTPDNDSNAIQDAAGNDAESLTITPVTNKTGHEILFANYYDIQTNQEQGEEVIGKIHLKRNKDINSNPIPKTYQFSIKTADTDIFKVETIFDDEGRAFGVLKVRDGKNSGTANTYNLSIELKNGNDVLGKEDIVIHVAEKTLWTSLTEHYTPQTLSNKRLYGSTEFSENKLEEYIDELERDNGQFSNYTFYGKHPKDVEGKKLEYQWQEVSELIGGLGHAYATSPTYGINSQNSANKERLKNVIYKSLLEYMNNVPIEGNDVMIDGNSIGEELGDGYSRLAENGYVANNFLTHQWRTSDALGAALIHIWPELIEDRANGKQEADDLYNATHRFYQHVFSIVPNNRRMDTLSARWGDIAGENYSEGAWSDANLHHRLRTLQLMPILWADYNKPITYVPYWYNDYFKNTEFDGKSLAKDWSPNGVLADLRHWVDRLGTPTQRYNQSGFHLDGTVTHHRGHGASDVAMLAYGYEWLVGNIEAIEYFKDTPFPINSDRYQFVADRLDYSYRRTIYKDSLDFLITGRSFDGDMSDFGSKKVSEDITGLIENKIDSTIITNESNILELQKNLDANTHEHTETISFWNADYLVHRNESSSDDYYFSVKNKSVRTAGAEDFGSIRKSWHLGSGPFLLRVDGDEYDQDVLLHYDWHTVPGVTEEWRTDALPLGEASASKPGGNLFSGVLADSEYGLSGYHHKPIDDYTAAEALKSYHLIGNLGTAIGSKIARKSSSSGSNEIVTTIDQSEQLGDITYNANGSTSTIIDGNSVDQTISLSEPSWIHHHNKGYLIFPRTNQNLLIKTGDAIKVTEKGQGKSINYILALDHGINPSELEKDGYEYVMVANVTAADMPSVLENYIKNRETLVSDGNYHALRDSDEQVSQATFFKPNKVTFKAQSFIEADKPALVSLKELENALRLTVVDPLHDLNSKELTINLSNKLKQGTYNYEFGGIHPRAGETISVIANGEAGSTIKVELPDNDDAVYYNYQEAMYAGAPIVITIPKHSVTNEQQGVLQILGTTVNDKDWKENVGGKLLRADLSQLSDRNTNQTITYQWYLDEASIAGATTRDFLIGNNISPGAIRVDATYTSSSGQKITASSPTITSGDWRIFSGGEERTVEGDYPYMGKMESNIVGDNPAPFMETYSLSTSSRTHTGGGWFDDGYRADDGIHYIKSLEAINIGLTAQEGSNVIKIGATSDSKRAELGARNYNTRVQENQDVYVSQKIYLPSSEWDPITQYSTLIFQHKQYPGADPNFEIRLSNLGDYKIYVRSPYSHYGLTGQRVSDYPIATLNPDKWHDLKIHLTPSKSNNVGQMAIYLDGEIIFSEQGTNLNDIDTTNDSFLKLGMYTQILDDRHYFVDSVEMTTFLPSTVSDWVTGATTGVTSPTRLLTLLDLENGSVTGDGTFDLGAEATLTATPSAGYVFASWSGDASSTDNPLTITMDDNKSIGATFTEDTRDPDGDGIGNNADTDDDGDGVLDTADAFPLDSSETVDTDSDGTGNNADADDDGDGVADTADAFPLDSTETVDTDGDGTGNNADTDDDGDGVADTADAFPLDSSESVDTDSDGIGNNADTDDDGDGVADGYASVTWNLESTFSGDQSRLSGDGSNLLYGHVSVTSPSVGDVFNVVRTSDLSAIGSQITPGPVSTYHPAISRDGTVVAFADAGTNVVEVYQYAGGAWSRKGSDITGSGYFGWSMDISGDGDKLVVGDRTGGYASVYEFDSGSWSQVGSNITGGGIGSERFGADVAISYDGSVVAIGGNQGGSNKNGVVRVYENDSGSWNQVGSDVYGSTDSRLGFSLGLSADGNTFASGAIRGSSGGSESGEVKVYELVSGSWVQVGSDISGDSAGDNFGHGTSISPDGNYIVSTSYDGGYAKVYQNVANSWTQLGSNLTESDWTGASYADISEGGSYVSFWHESGGEGKVSLYSISYQDAFPLDSSESVDTDSDGTGNNADTDDDGDGVLDTADAFPLDSAESLDTDGDGTGNNADTDDDNDGVADTADAFPLDSTESVDTDGDGTGNNADTDDDGDGVADTADAFPLDSSETIDTDSDGTGNNADTDDDNDGVADTADAFPLDSTESVDTDGDGIGNNADTDDDGDGVADTADAFPLDSSESVDTDSDGTGNNADPDDDGDDVIDTSDAFPLDSSESVDTDSDGTGNNADTDDDGDDVIDTSDAFPLDSSESVDTDSDGTGNNADTDDDGDGVIDTSDAFPLDSSESVDTDSDGTGNNADTDDDGDGVADTADAFPLDSSESVDTDGDGTGNNADTDDDGDGVADTADAFPLDSSESVDTDGDGIGNNADTDDDNDGVEDTVDAFPLDSSESVDTDSDGIGNNADTDDDGDGVADGYASVTWNLESTFSGDQSRLSGDGSNLLYGHVSVTSPSVGDVFNVVRTSDLSAIGSQITPGPVSTYHPAISRDGTVVAFADAGTNVVEVYQYAGGAWSRKGSDITGSGYFGWSMDISGDGDKLVVGDRTGGYASVYEFDSGSWSQVGSNITGGGIGSERFGADVAISYDGSVVAIGGNQGGSNKNGVVRVYENDSGSWNQVGSDVYGSTDSRLGFSLGLSADGNTFASGAIRGSSGGSESGEVKVYELVSGSWVQVGSDISGDSAGDNFGHGTSISPDGNYIVSTSYDGGYAKVYQNVANSWTQLGSNLTESDWTGASYADISEGGSYVSFWHESGGEGKVSLYSISYQDAFPLDSAISIDTDGDGIENTTDPDDDNDGVADTADAFPLDSAESVDTDSDGTGNNADIDDDGDGVLDTIDAFPLDSSESVDTDSDGTGNNADTDDDGDGVLDTADALPLDSSESVDTDSDGTGNNADTDDDGDGFLDTADAFPLDSSETVDTDSDGTGNNADTDDDGDGVADTADAFPLDSFESVDTDSDGTGNNADTDDDGDGVLDTADAFPLDSSESVDTDSDGTGNNADTDDDGDGVLDTADAFPLDSAESIDTDSDGTGNSADTDDDGDGVLDKFDLFPLDFTEYIDSDSDGVGDNTDAFPFNSSENADTDGDGVGDNGDAFPSDANESGDADGDGIGNNADPDDDNDGVLDIADAFPLDSSESVDTDSDGTGNNADTDDDGDGVADTADAFPLDSSESVDTDGDGTGNNADTDDDGDGVADTADAFPLDPDRSSSSNWVQLGSDIDGEYAGDRSGESVSLSSDGTTVAIGAYQNDGNGTLSGHVRIYSFDAGSSTWTQVGSDINGESAGDRSGMSVSLSSDGSSVAIGAIENDGNGGDSGHVRVYSFDAGSSTWTQVGSDIDGESADDLSGISVSLSSDGSTVAIGAIGDDGNGSNSGHVRVYSYDAGSSTWTQVGSDIDGESAGDGSGRSVSLSSDGTTVAIGAIWGDGTVEDPGHVRIYSFDSGSSTWTQVGSDIDGDTTGDYFGLSVFLSSDGTTVAIGAPYNVGNGNTSGRVRIYSFDSETSSWVQLGSDIDGESGDDLSGMSVSLSSDGSTVAIGAPHVGFESRSGHVRIYSFDAGSSTWTQVGSDIDGESAGDRSGMSVSLSSDGSTVAIGAIENDGNGSGSGHVRIYSFDTDGDGVLDTVDAFPLDSNESVDTDGDGTGNNADTDDDSDGVLDTADAFPLDSSETVDTDSDGTGNNADTDDDDDGVADTADAFPLDSTESVDTDSDGTGNNADTDDDGDGVADTADAFPLDSNESVDTDGDGTGNNADTDDDGDGVLDTADALPLDSSETVDTDSDGTGNNADTDDDGDGVLDNADAFPLDSSESVDTDNDGVGDNSDADANGDGVLDSSDWYLGNSSPLLGTDGSIQNPQGRDAYFKILSWGLPSSVRPGETIETKILLEYTDEAHPGGAYDREDPVFVSVFGNWSKDSSITDLRSGAPAGDPREEDYSFDFVAPSEEREYVLRLVSSNGSRISSSYYGEDDSSILGAYAEISFAVVASGGAPATPAGLSATSGAETVSLNWDPIADVGLSGYDVYRGLSLDSGSMEKVNSGGPVYGNDFVDSTVSRYQTYYYRLRAVGEDGQVSGFSKSASATVSRIVMRIDDYAGSPGSEVSMTISAENAVGVSGNGLDLRVTYDQSILEPVSVEKTYLTEGFIVAHNASTASGQINISAISSSGSIQALGGLFDIVFRVSESASLGSTGSHVLVDARLFDENLDSLSVDYSDTAEFVVSNKYRLGDISGDGEVFSQDALLAMRHALGDRIITEDTKAFMAGDINKDGLIDAADVSLILEMSVGKASASAQSDISAQVFSENQSSAYYIKSRGAASAPVPSDVWMRVLSENQSSAYYIESGDASPLGGGRVMVPVSIGGPSGIRGVELQIGYDPSVLDLSEVSSTGGFSSYLVGNGGVRGSERILLAKIPGTTVSSSGGIELVFELTGSPGSTSPVRLIDYKIIGENSEDISYFSEMVVTESEVSAPLADADGDGVGDESDAFPLDPTESFDTDSDGVGDNGDQFPLNSSETVDTDSDGTGNNADTDDDGDGVLDTSDAFPLDSSESVDTDSDGTGNNADPDDDNDGVLDTADAFPLDSKEYVDSDSDGVGDNGDMFPTDSLNGDFQFQHVDDPNTSETIQVTWETTSGIGYNLEVSTDLFTWTLLRTYPPSEGLDIHSFEFSTENPQLFIRLKPYTAQD